MANDYGINQYIYDSRISSEDIERIVSSPISKRYTKVYLLHQDETPAKDITEWVQASGSIEKNFESGQSYSTSLTLINPLVKTPINKSNLESIYTWYTDLAGEAYTTLTGEPYFSTELRDQAYSRYVNEEEKSRFNPLKRYDDFEANTKVQITSVVELNGEQFEIPQGVFVVHDPKMSESEANKSVSIQLYDKFALLDGTISGDGEFEYEIPYGTKIRDAIVQLLRLPRNKKGEPFDFKDIRFPVKHKDAILAYTIKKTGDNAIGELIKEMCLSISCGVRYDEFGYLTVTEENEYLESQYHPVTWNFEPKDYNAPSLDIKRSQVKNRVVVEGANINGILCRGEAENTNIGSLYSVYGPFGTRSKKITDSLIPSHQLCRDRARYELQMSMRKYISLSFQCSWIPHLKPGDIIRWTKPEWQIWEEEFIINSISLPVNGTEMMSISATNLNEIS